MKRTILSAATGAILAVATASTGHAWFFTTDVNVKPQSAGGNLYDNSFNRTDSPNYTNSKNFGSQNSGDMHIDSGNHASAKGGGGWWGGWWGGWGGGGGKASANATSQNSTGQGGNFGLMGNGGNSLGHSQTFGDTIMTGNTYNGSDVIQAKEATEQARIAADKEIQIRKFAR